MFSIIKTPSHNKFYGLIKEAKENIYLCAPFIKKSIVDKILENKSYEIEMVVITSANISNFMCGSLDISAIKELIKKGVTVRNYQNLHAKIYIFDRKKVLVTSANLTNNALYKNFEYGVLIDDSLVADKIYDDYVEMVNSEDCGVFNVSLLDRLDKIKKQFKKTPTINIDVDNDTIIVEDKDKLILNMSSWQKDVFEIINEFDESLFNLKDVYLYKLVLKNKHSNNNNIEAKIRQVLQQLRDLGFIKFVEKGKYKKLWIDKSRVIGD